MITLTWRELALMRGALLRAHDWTMSAVMRGRALTPAEKRLIARYDRLDRRLKAAQRKRAT